VVFAHGGLTDLTTAQNYVSSTADWWLSNNVYPLYFVWQSGAFESLIDMIEDEVRKRAGLQLATAMPPSPTHLIVNQLTVDIVRNFAPVKNLWAEMKQNAKGLSQPSPSSSKGGLVLASLLQSYVVAHPGTEIHLVGHSAGSIVHASFLNALVNLGIKVSSLSYLAAAIRSDDFLSTAFEHVQNGDAKSFTMYCLDQDLELADTCTDVVTAYYGSLLWLVSRGFEWLTGGLDQTPILGMQYFLEQADPTSAKPTLEQLITKAGGSIYFSPTSPQTQATSHGGFASEHVTMDSVAISIVGSGKLKQRFPNPLPTAAGG
jgi:hypothetical protein